MDDRKSFEIGGLTVLGATEDHEHILRGRDAFIDDYCRQKGWEKSKLSLGQILEIRQQDGWKNPAPARPQSQ